MSRLRTHNNRRKSHQWFPWDDCTHVPRREWLKRTKLWVKRKTAVAREWDDLMDRWSPVALRSKP